MLCKSKISNGFQTVVPSKIRKEYGVEAGDILEWIDTEDGVLIKFRKPRTLRTSREL